MWRVLGVVMTFVACGPMAEAPLPACGPSTCGVSASCADGQCVKAVMPALHVDAGSIDAGSVDSGSLDAGGREADAGTLRVDAGVPDAGLVCPVSAVMPRNHALNGDLECGALPFQSSGGGGRVEIISGRSGRAMRFTVAAGLFNNEFSSTWRFRVTQAGTWCARAFVKGSASVISLRLYLGPPGTAAGEVFDMPGPLTGWSRLPPTLSAVNATGQVGDEGFLVFVERTHTPGATIEVDDVDVWRSADGQCRDAR